MNDQVHTRRRTQYELQPATRVDVSLPNEQTTQSSKNEALFRQWSAKAPGSPHCVTTACTREDKPAGHQGWNVRHPSPCLQRKGDPPKNDCRTWASTRKPWTLPSRSPRLYGGCPPCGEPVVPTAPKPPRNLVSANAPNPPGRVTRVSTLPNPVAHVTESVRAPLLPPWRSVHTRNIDLAPT